MSEQGNYPQMTPIAADLVFVLRNLRNLWITHSEFWVFRKIA
jgi:hypothetical protein